MSVATSFLFRARLDELNFLDIPARCGKEDEANMKNLDVGESDNIMEYNGLKVCKDSEGSSVLSSLSHSVFTCRCSDQGDSYAIRTVLRDFLSLPSQTCGRK